MRVMIGLQAHVQRLAGDIGERNVFHAAALNDAASYIESEWKRQGYAVSQLMYEVSGVRCANLEVVRGGKARRREILLIGAHYDSVVGSPGANDNGSGVAALLEISRRFVAIEPAMTVRFVAFVNEEPPFFMSKQQGSMVYAKSARHRDDDIPARRCGGWRMLSKHTPNFPYRRWRPFGSFPASPGTAKDQAGKVGNPFILR